MPTYNLSARNKLRAPSGAVGEPPDGPGGIAALRDDVDNYLGVGGAEYCATTTVRDQIPSSRLFKGKLAYCADTDIVYRFDSTSWFPWGCGPRNYTPTVNNLTLGNGSLSGSYWFTTGVLKGRISLAWGSTTSASGSPLFNFPNTGQNADTNYQHCGTATLNRSTSSRPTLTAILDSSARFALWQTSGSAFTSTSPLTLQAGDVISAMYEVKF